MSWEGEDGDCRVTTKYYQNSRVFHIDGVTPETWDAASCDIPKTTRRLVVSGDYLDELIIPEGIASCVCHSLGLRRLIVPDGVEYLWCNNNTLRALELPQSMYICDVSYNPLRSLTFRGGDVGLVLGRIQMNNVKLTSFHAKVKNNCEIDMDNNPQLVSLSPEVEYAAFTYPYEGETFREVGI